ncbi:cyclophilin-like fold protein [Christensenella tenuis]|jgi:hypothetical protein|uniref:Flavodoxin-like domain-containing protein n=1 Tax=Christensenella tenuis TaxID=2763033 RepID=A0ABR7EDE9_9FIRM|nr:cyclophilin-like fold protein [Christensenella tenuis]MBC5647776.1 hypothetical protein [Christensenella tenuis]
MNRTGKMFSFFIAVIFTAILLISCGPLETEPLQAAGEGTVPTVTMETSVLDGAWEMQPVETSAPSGILVAYFSRTGNTETIAGWIQETFGGDLFQICTEDAYPEDYNELLDIAQQEQATGARPALSGQVQHMEAYDTVFIGYPIWWADMPMAVYTFLEEYDLSGKTVIPFCTHGSSGFSGTQEIIASLQPGAKLLEGIAVRGEQAADSHAEVVGWLAGLSLEGAGNTVAASGEEIRIRFSFDNGEAIAVLSDTPTVQSLLMQLPATVTMNDYAGAEKIAYFSESLSDEGAPEGYDPQIGDVACYGPWGNMAVFYNDQPYAEGLCLMGKIESGMDLLAALPENASVTIERVG